MIIELLLSALYNIFNLLTTPISIPSLPSSVDTILNSCFNYMADGIGIFANFVNITYVMSLFTIILAIDVGIAIYHLVMWILRKIPMASIS